jgi:hypothetical protein
MAEAMEQSKGPAQTCGGPAYTMRKDGVICGQSSLPDCGYSDAMLETLRAAGFELYKGEKKLREGKA